MISLSLLKLLENEGFGTIDTDMFFQKLTLDKKGLYIADVGTANEKGLRETQGYELLARGNSDVDGYKLLRDIRKFIKEEGESVCELPAVPPVTTKNYKGVRLGRPSSITNVGLDAQNRIIYSITGTITYQGE